MEGGTARRLEVYHCLVPRGIAGLCFSYSVITTHEPM